MKAVFINSKEETVTEVEVNDNENILHQWYKILGVNMVEVACYINEQEDAIIVDEEGLLTLTNNTKFFTYEGAHQPFAGNGLITGKDDEGESISCHVTADDVRPKIKFYTLDQVQTLFK